MVCVYYIKFVLPSLEDFDNLLSEKVRAWVINRTRSIQKHLSENDHSLDPSKFQRTLARQIWFQVLADRVHEVIEQPKDQGQTQMEIDATTLPADEYEEKYPYGVDFELQGGYQKAQVKPYKSRERERRPVKPE